MAEAVDLRDLAADGIAQGYAEAMVGAKVWKVTGGRMRRPWARPGPHDGGLTGAALEAAIDALALRFPGYVTVEV